MAIKLVIVVGLIIVLIFIGLIIFLRMMSGHKKKVLVMERIDRNSEIICPTHILDRYKLWYSSFIAWTCINYGFSLTALLCSLSAIYFAADTHSDSSTQLVIVFSLAAAFMTMGSIILTPELHARGFYKAYSRLEQAIVKYKVESLTENDPNSVEVNKQLLLALLTVLEECEKETKQ